MKLLAVLLVIGAPVMAQEAEGFDPLPTFKACMDEEAARYERALRGLTGMREAQEFEIGDTRGVGYCGSVGFVLCDRKGALKAVQACQLEFAEQQDALAEKVRASLPEPEVVADKGGPFEQALYPRVYALAQGSSAGPDCAGDLPQRGTWCTAWEANNRLSNAFLTWQLARYLGAAETAVDAGWADVPPPQRPLARDRGDQ